MQIRITTFLAAGVLALSSLRTRNRRSPAASRAPSLTRRAQPCRARRSRRNINTGLERSTESSGLGTTP